MRVLVAAGTLVCGLGCGGADVGPPTNGSLEITTATSGRDPDSDGYAVAIDGGAAVALGVNASLQRHDLDPGSHTVQLTGLAAHCTLTGDNPRTISIASGQMARVTFQVTCTAATGTLQITAATSGPSPDPDGYSVTLDGTDRGVLITGTVLIVDRLPAGDHVVGLSGIAANCQIQGDNPRTVSLTAGQTASVTFNIACTAPQARIAFVSGRNGNSEIYVMNSDGTGLTRLTNTPEDESEPAWSPDGTRIAFSRDRDIFIMNTDGSAQTRLTNSASLESSPTWSPDGTKIAFLRPDGDYPDLYQEIAIMNADGTGAVRLKGVGDFDGLDWSRDGSRLAYADEQEDEPAMVGVVNVDGSDSGLITNGYDFSPAWSPDGRIAFVNIPYDYNDEPAIIFTGDAEIWVMNADGSGQTQLTDNEFYDGGPAWSRDGRKIAFVSNRDKPGIYVMNADGSDQTWLTNGGEPSWSP